MVSMMFMPLKFSNIRSHNLTGFSKNVYGIYRAQTDYGLLTGVICLFEININRSKVSIIPHECTLSEKVGKYFNELRLHSIQTTPILLAYDTDEHMPDLVDFIDGQTHNKDLTTVYPEVSFISPNMYNIKGFLDQINEVFLLDGHHRYAAATHLAATKGVQTITVMLVPKRRLFLDAFHRMVVSQNTVDTTRILEQLKYTYHIEQVPSLYIPRTQKYFGMMLDGRWYKLQPHKHDGNDICNSLNLSKNILDKIFREDAGTIYKVEYINSKKVVELRSNASTLEIIFTLSPVLMDEYVETTRRNRTFPPHTTCFLPKPSTDCLIYSHVTEYSI